MKTYPGFRTPLILVIFIVSGLFAGNIHASVMPDYDRLNPVTIVVNAPTDVSVDTSGNIYVVESSNNRLIVFSQGGNYKQSLIGLNRPISVAVDSNGRIFIGNKDRGNVEAYDSGLNLLFKLGSGDGEFSQPNDIAIDSSGNVYVSDYLEDKIKVYYPDGSFNYSYGSTGSGNGEFNYPTAVTIDEISQEIFVLDRQLTQGTYGIFKGARIQVFDMNWGFKRSFGDYGDLEGQMNKPKGIDVDSDGRIYVTESQYHVVYVYDSNSGLYLGKITDVNNPLRTPLGITIGNGNRLYIASLNTGSVEIYGIIPYTNMEVVPLSLSFQGKQYGSNPPLQTVEIRNNGTRVLDWTAYTGDGWITISDTSGSTNISSFSALEVGVDISMLSPGTYTGSVIISADSGAMETVDVSLSVQSNPPIANPGGPYSDTEGQTIILDASNSDGGLVLYEWDIDNNGTYDYSTSLPTQSHVYTQQGTYTIKLRVTDQGSATDDALTTAYISDSFPSADFTASPTSGTAPLTVNFMNNSTGYDQPLSYEWDFDSDGTVDSTATNPSYVYTSPGIYSVTLTVTDSDGSTNSLNKSNYISISSAYVLTVSRSGNGSGTVSSLPAGIDCGTDCTETYSDGTAVTLSALPDAGSTFTGWSGGGCSGTGSCVVTMNSDTNITALFDSCPNLPVRITGTVPAYYSSLQSAYDASMDGDIIQSHASRFTENLNLNINKSVTLQGGFACDYSSTIGKTTLEGIITINDGAAIVENYILQ